MIGLWAGLGMMLWIGGCIAYERLVPIKVDKVSHDEPRPMCACAARGSASMQWAYYAGLNGGHHG